MTPEEIRSMESNDWTWRAWAGSFFKLIREGVAQLAELVALKREEAAKPPAPISWPLTVPPPSAAPVWTPLPGPNTVPYPSTPTWPTITCGPVKTLCQSDTNEFRAAALNPDAPKDILAGEHASGLAPCDRDNFMTNTEHF